MNDYFPTFNKFFTSIKVLGSKLPLLAIILVIVFVVLFRSFIEYINFPLPTHVGIDWGYHFSWTFYMIDAIVWAGVFYILYKFIKPIFKNKIAWLTAILLAVVFTGGSLLFSPLINKTSYSTGYRLREYQNNNGLCSNRIDDFKGMPYDYIHHWYCYDTGGKMVWDYIELETDYLILNGVFWLSVSFIIVRFVHLATAKNAKTTNPTPPSS